MNEHLSEQQIQDYRARCLPATQRLEVSDHIAACEACRQRVSSGEQAAPTRVRIEQALAADLRSAQREELAHLPYEAIAAYVDGTAGTVEQEVVEEHAAICPLCATELQELLSFRDMLQQFPDREWTPGANRSTALRDSSGDVAVDSAGTVRLAGIAQLPLNVARWIAELVTEGLVTPVKTIGAVIDQLVGATAPAPLLAVRRVKSPTPIGPVSTVVRSTCPTLRWEPVPGAQEYNIVIVHQVADTGGRTVVWEGSVGDRLSFALPVEAALTPGQSYLWQVSAEMRDHSLESTPAWFTVLAADALEEVEAEERAYKHSALICAGLYEAYGLYEEALDRLQELAKYNPENPLLQRLRDGLLQRPGR